MNRTQTDAVAQAITAALVSPNECDSNGEAAGPTDGLYALARSVDRLARAVEVGLGRVAESVEHLAEMLDSPRN